MIREVERWRSAGCSSATLASSRNFFFIKYKEINGNVTSTTSTGYEIYLTNFDGLLWKERLEGSRLQDRLKVEAAGLEIETCDLLKLLAQMCQNLNDSTTEISSDRKTLWLRASVKIGFIKLKWTFKAEACNEEYISMVRTDLLVPLLAGLREDKVVAVRGEIKIEDLNLFYETVVPKLVFESAPETTTQNSLESETTTLASPYQSHIETILEELNVPVDIEEVKRKALEDQLMASKKKKKKLI